MKKPFGFTVIELIHLLLAIAWIALVIFVVFAIVHFIIVAW